MSLIILLGNLYSKISEFLFLFNHMDEFLHFYLFIFFWGLQNEILIIDWGIKNEENELLHGDV